jgi:hypothetical protein
MNIYLDMDDVVADWKLYVEHFLEYKFVTDERIPDHLWKKLKSYSRLYRDLPVKQDAYALTTWCKKWAEENNAGLYFLSAIPKGNDMPWAAQDKVFWAQRNFSGIPVFLGPYAHEKYMHCKTPGDILIDDRVSNCQQWISVGGRAHVYKNWPDCQQWLIETLGVIE